MSIKYYSEVIITIFVVIMMGISSCFGIGLKSSNVTGESRFLQLLNDPVTGIGKSNVEDDHRKFKMFVNEFETQLKANWGIAAAKRTNKTHVFNVVSFGAKGNGKTDDSKAFLKAWKKACYTRDSTLLVPSKKIYYLKPISFLGPCKGVTIVKIQGIIKASKKISDYTTNRHQWIKFHGVKNLNVIGGGTIDGNGQVWWTKSCKKDKKQQCKPAPTALMFADCTNVKVEELRIQNAQQMHMTFHSCKNVEVLNIIIKSPGDSPNTDGIHVSGTNNILIDQCDIQTGDDCISIVSGSHQVKAQNIKCGPGHGISIGSLGQNGAHDVVSNILVDSAIISNTENGVRIKSWQGGSGIAENIAFQNIYMHNVTNPIIIDQYYCDKNGKTCSEKKQAVQVKNVLYKNIKGTSAKDKGVVLKCSKSLPCNTIKLQDVDLSYKGYNSEATCISANVQEIGIVVPSCPKLIY